MLSRYDEIDSLDFAPMPSKPVSMVKVVTCDGVTVGIGKHGRLYTDCHAGNNAAHMPGNWRWDRGLFQCLVKLGLVSKATVARHQALTKARRESDSAQSTIKYTVPKLEEYGIKLTAAQMRKLTDVAEADFAAMGKAVDEATEKDVVANLNKIAKKAVKAGVDAVKSGKAEPRQPSLLI